MSTFNKYLPTFMIISCFILSIMRQFPDKSFRENQNTLFIFNKFLSEPLVVYEITKFKTHSLYAIHFYPKICRL